MDMQEAKQSNKKIRDEEEIRLLTAASQFAPHAKLGSVKLCASWGRKSLSESFWPVEIPASHRHFHDENILHPRHPLRPQPCGMLRSRGLPRNGIRFKYWCETLVSMMPVLGYWRCPNALWLGGRRLCLRACRGRF